MPDRSNGAPLPFGPRNGRQWHQLLAKTPPALSRRRTDRKWPVFAVHDCKVAVDPATGHVEVLSYAVVQDVGRALNPRAIASQIQGGAVQGLQAMIDSAPTDHDDAVLRQLAPIGYKHINMHGILTFDLARHAASLLSQAPTGIQDRATK